MKTKQILSIMHIVAWILFIGLCIKAGALIISFFVSLFVNEYAVQNIYLGLDFSRLYNFSQLHYIITVSLIILIASLKANLFYLLINVFRKVDFNSPFTEPVAQLLSKINKVVLYTALIALLASGYSAWLHQQTFFYPYNWGAQSLLFMAGVVFIVALLFKRAVEIQSENELTI